MQTLRYFSAFSGAGGFAATAWCRTFFAAIVSHHILEHQSA
jgi:hypothetical protein